MSKIKGKDTAPELWLRRFLWSRGFRYRLHVKGLPGSPDIVMAKWGAAIFVHGCFWHHHDGCALFKLPKTNTDFWREKLTANAQRDFRSVKDLAGRGWRILVVWECAIRFDTAQTETEVLSWITEHTPSANITRQRDQIVIEPIPPHDGRLENPTNPV
ncbi:DNA mismatch endonuclease (patch repair protein) [Luteibacter sp. 621]